MKKRAFGLLICFLLFSTPTTGYGAERAKKLEWHPVFRTSEMVDVIAEGWEDPWFGSVEKTYQAMSSADYSAVLTKWQCEWIRSLQDWSGVEVMDTYTLSFNGIWIRTRGYQVPLLARSSLIKKVHLMQERVYPTRDKVRSTIQMPSFEEVKRDGQYPDGSGTVIGIVDTGIFYGHEDFWPAGATQSPMFPNEKIIQGYDFADKDQDPIDDRSGHGTHVAGIAAGNHAENQFNQGIAPKAALIAYKVFSSKANAGGASSATIVSAAERALKDGCTVINLSLGHNGEAHSTYEDSPYYTALESAVKGGVVVVASAGNDGSRLEENPWPIHAPGVFYDLIQVGATDDRGLQQLELHYPSSWSRTINGNLARHTPPFTEKHNIVPIVEAGYGRKEDFKETDVKGKIVLISRGPEENSLSFQAKNLNAKENGAVGCIIYNHHPETFKGTMITLKEDPSDFEFLPTLMVSGMVADQIRFCLQNEGSMEFHQPKLSMIADYTSAGPCLDGDLGVFKPEVCAPGTSIRSAVPATDSSKRELISAWTDLSGTSMASPVVTGVVALLKQAHPEWTPYQVKCALMNTADLLTNPLNQEVFSFYYQGSGQVNMQQALTTKALLSPPSIMRCSGSIGEKASIKLENITDDPLSVEIRSMFFTSSTPSVTLLTNQPFLVIPPHSTEQIEYWFHTETKQFDWTTLEGVMWFQIRSQNEPGEPFQSLHIPMILYAESTEFVQKPVHRASISQSQLNRKDRPIVSVQYALHTGSITKIIDEVPGEKEGETKKTVSYSARNFASLLQLQVYDRSGQLIHTEYLGEQIPVGRYEFAWDGKALEGMDVLPDGPYSLFIATRCNELIYKTEQEERKLVSQTAYWEKSNPVRFEIVNSQASVKPVLLMATPSVVSAYTTQGVAFYVENAQEIDEVKVQIFYDKEHLSPIQSEVQSFIHNEDLSEFSWTVRRPYAVEPRFFLGKHLFQWSKSGNRPIKEIKVTCSFKGIPLKREAVIAVPDITISEEKSCVGDFNQDSIVNELDYWLWLPHFGTTWRSIGWDPSFDLNNDWVIDTEDLLLLCRCMQ